MPQWCTEAHNYYDPVNLIGIEQCYVYELEKEHFLFQ